MLFRSNVLGFQPRLRHRLLDGGPLGFPNRPRILLYPARLGVAGGQGLLSRARHTPIGMKNHASRTGSALIQGHQISHWYSFGVGCLRRWKRAKPVIGQAPRMWHNSWLRLFKEPMKPRPNRETAPKGETALRRPTTGPRLIETASGVSSATSCSVQVGKHT